MIKRKNPKGNLLAFVLYDDKVNLNMQANAEAVFATLGNFSPALMHKDVAKIHLGFITGTDNHSTTIWQITYLELFIGTESINESLLSNHLQKLKKVGANNFIKKTVAEKMVNYL
jgi:hypothetical protein